MKGKSYSLDIGKCSIVMVFLYCLSSTIFADTKVVFSKAVDAVFEKQGGGMSYERLMDQLWEFYQHPIHLNHTSPHELKQLQLLSTAQITAFFDHIAQNGVLVSKYELQVIDGFDQKTIDCLLPFITIEEISPAFMPQGVSLSDFPLSMGHFLSRYERVLEQQQGYKQSQSGEVPYSGSADKLVIRFKWKGLHGWGFGMAARKYPGEAFMWDPMTERYGVNVWSAYLMLENKKWLKKVILGSYQVGYGQGVILNAGFHMDRSGETLMISRTSNIGIKPYSSFNGSGLRGIATTCQWGDTEQSFYYAYNSLDGQVVRDDGQGEACYVRRVERNGVYRTAKEIDKKAQVSEHMVGSTLVYRPSCQTEIGLNLLYNHYDVPIGPKLEAPSYYFSGKYNCHVGVFYRYLWHNFHFFGEHALSYGGGSAHVLGVLASLSSCIDVSLLARHYSPTFYSFYGDSFRENGNGNCNEQGIYLGLKLSPLKQLQVTAYYDYFRGLQPTYTLSQPCKGYRWLLKVMYPFTTTHLWLVQYKELKKLKNIPQPSFIQQSGVGKVAPYKKRQCKTTWKQQCTSSIGLHSEIQVSAYRFLDQFTWGYGLAQRITWQHRALRLIGQVAWFDTDTHNQLYFNEKTISRSPSFVGVNKMGIKAYLLVGCQFGVHWRMEAKHSLTWYIAADQVGSGHDKIEGNAKNTLSLQLLYKF